MAMSDGNMIQFFQGALSEGALSEITKLLKTLESESGKFNIFNVLGVDGFEIRHSFMLKWLLSPSENHGLGSLFLALFIEEMVRENRAKHSDRYERLCGIDSGSFVVDREVEDIDLLLVSEKAKIVIAVENKWNAEERVDTEDKDGQLTKYRKWVNKNYPMPTWNQLFIFLTPDKRPASDGNVEIWDSLGYENIRCILEDKRISEKLAGDETLAAQKFLVEHYLEIIKRRLMMDDMEARCTEIYDQYRKEFDFIFDRADRRDPLLRTLYRGIQVGGEFLCAEKSDSKSYVQYRRRLPKGVLDSVHYEILVGENLCKVFLHVEKHTMPSLKSDLENEIHSICEEKGFQEIAAKKEDSTTGVVIPVSRVGKNNDVAEEEVRNALTRLYDAFESVLQKYDMMQ